LLKSQREELTHQVFELKQMAQNLAISLARFEENIRARETELQRLRERQAQVGLEKTQCTEKDALIQNEAQELQKAWAASLEEHNKHEERVRVEQEVLKSFEGDVSQKSEEVTILRVQIAGKKERMMSLARSLEQIAMDLSECKSALAKLADQSKTLKEEQVELAQRNELVARKFEEAHKERTHLATVLATQQTSYEADSQVLKEKENSLSGLRNDLDTTRQLSAKFW